MDQVCKHSMKGWLARSSAGASETSPRQGMFIFTRRRILGKRTVSAIALLSGQAIVEDLISSSCVSPVGHINPEHIVCLGSRKRNTNLAQQFLMYRPTAQLHCSLSFELEPLPRSSELCQSPPTKAPSHAQFLKEKNAAPSDVDGIGYWKMLSILL